MLGFKDVGSFRRAFLSWTGESAGAWQTASCRVRSAVDGEHRLGVG